MSKDVIYLAGPFFNERQLDTIAQMESILRDAGHEVISPREQHEAGTPTKVEMLSHAQRIMELNKRWIHDSDTVVAWLDWVTSSEGEEVRLVGPSLFDTRDFLSPPLNIPDAGTCWELGYASSLSKYIILCQFRPAKPNVMLAASADGVVRTLDELRASANDNWRISSKQAGPFQ